MPNWRRAHVPGGSYFFTVVTLNRAPLFGHAVARKVLGEVMRRCMARWPARIDAIVLLPEHLHAIWSLPPGDNAYSLRWAWLKKEFTKSWLNSGGSEQSLSPGRARDGRRGVWQSKFWEHTLCDEDDFERHFDYIHFNPVKHGLAACPRDWPWTSFHRWVAAGVYTANWACGDSHSGQPAFDSISQSVGE